MITSARRLMSIGVALSLLGALTACSDGGESDGTVSVSTVTETRTVTVTTVAGTTSTTSSLPPASTTGTTITETLPLPPAETTVPETTTTSATPAFDPDAIRSIDIKLGGYGEVGPNLYQLGRDVRIAVNWTARGENGDVDGDGCTSILDLTGPGGTDERRRTESCSLTGISWYYDDLEIAGLYTISLSVAPANGGAPILASLNFEILPEGA